MTATSVDAVAAPTRGGDSRPQLSDDGRITVVNAGKDYASLDGQVVHGLRPVSITIPDGAFVSIVGRSGCGKSTFLRLVAGLERNSFGSIHIGDELVTGPPNNARYVFQNYNESLLPWKSVGDNVRFGLRHGTRKIKSTVEQNQIIESYLEEVGLGGTANRYPGELSGGMQQRLAIARALAAAPKVLLLDEPFSAVDALSRTTLQDLVLRIWQEHRLTVLFVTHDIEEALFLSQRVIVLGEAGAGIQRDVSVDIDYPRKQVDFREDSRYLHLRREVLSLVLGTE